MTVSPASRLTDPTRILELRAEILARSAALQKTEAPPEPIGSFDEALSRVSTLQNTATDVSKAFDRGDMTDIAQVMIARQKASVAFEATLQVRNKLLGAYRDIMNMGV